MSEILLNRLENGGSVDPNAPLYETMPTIGGGGGAAFNPADFTIEEVKP